jgi:hypothetical protein
VAPQILLERSQFGETPVGRKRRQASAIRKQIKRERDLAPRLYIPEQVATQDCVTEGALCPSQREAWRAGPAVGYRIVNAANMHGERPALRIAFCRLEPAGELF